MQQPAGKKRVLKRVECVVRESLRTSFLAMTVGARLEVRVATPPGLRTMPSAASQMHPRRGLGMLGSAADRGRVVASGSQGREPMDFGGRRRGQKMAPWMGQAGLMISCMWLSGLSGALLIRGLWSSASAREAGAVRLGPPCAVKCFDTHVVVHHATHTRAVW